MPTTSPVVARTTARLLRTQRFAATTPNSRPTRMKRVVEPDSRPIAR